MTDSKLTEAERSLGHQHSPWRWYREDAVESILSARLADAEARYTNLHHGILQQMKREHEAALAQARVEGGQEALRAFRPRCPQHGIPDCSPLLNDCRYPAYLRNQLDVAADALGAEHG